MNRLTFSAVALLVTFSAIPAFAVPRTEAVENGCQFMHQATYDLWVQNRELLGNPISHEQLNVRSPQGTDGTFMLFERGEINCLLNGGIRGKAFIVRGGIGQKYSAFAGPRGWLGYPISNEYRARRGGDGQRFEGGTIFWDAAAGAFSVRQASDR